MKHSSAFINYLGYITLFEKAMLDHDYEKSKYYVEEMNNILPKISVDELLEISTIMDIFNRQ